MEKMDRRFVAIVRTVLKKHGVQDRTIDQIIQATPDIPCLDQYVGVIRSWERYYDVDGERVLFYDDFKCRSHVSASQTEGRQIVIVVLESPNFEEYYKRTDGAWRQIGPAHGYSGYVLRRHWRDVFKDMFADADLYLLNAVQFQCSLSSAKKYLRSIVGKKFLKQEILNRCLKGDTSRFVRNFKKRINCILKMGYERASFVNACTKGGGAYWNVVAKCLEAFAMDKQGVDVYETNHPRAWALDTHRGLKKFDGVSSYVELAI